MHLWIILLWQSVCQRFAGFVLRNFGPPPPLPADNPGFPLPIPPVRGAEGLFSSILSVLDRSWMPSLSASTFWTGSEVLNTMKAKFFWLTLTSRIVPNSEKRSRNSASVVPFGRPPTNNWQESGMSRGPPPPPPNFLGTSLIGVRSILLRWGSLCGNAAVGGAACSGEEEGGITYGLHLIYIHKAVLPRHKPSASYSKCEIDISLAFLYVSFRPASWAASELQSVVGLKTVEGSSCFRKRQIVWALSTSRWVPQKSTN